MSGIDWYVISLYLAGMLGLSLWIGRRQRDLGDYYLGGRRLAWWAVGISVLATQSSAISFVSVPAFVGLREGGGLAWLHYELALPLAMILIGVWLIPALRGAGVTTIYEYLEQRYDYGVRRAVAFMFLLSRGLATGVTLYATAIVMEVCLGLRLEVTIALIGGVTLLYDLMGGMTAVVVSDVIQAGVLLLGLALCVWFAADGGAGVMAAWQAFPAERQATLFAGGEPAQVWAFLLGGLFLYASYYGCDQSQAQRLLATRSVGEARRALLLNGIARFPLTLAYALLGVVAASVWAGSGVLQGAVPVDSPDYLVPQLVLATLPEGLRGLVFAALLAAGMSSLDSAINALSASTVRDFVARGRDLAPKRALWYGRLTTLAWGLAVTAFAFFVDDIADTVIESINKIGSAFFGPVLAVFLLALRRRRPVPRWTVVALAAGVAGNLLLWRFAPGLHWMWWNVLGCALTAAIGVAVERAAGVDVATERAAGAGGAAVPGAGSGGAVEPGAGSGGAVEPAAGTGVGERAARPVGFVVVLVTWFVIVLALVAWLGAGKA